jgi:hypothetical protein
MIKTQIENSETIIEKIPHPLLYILLKLNNNSTLPHGGGLRRGLI